MRIALFICDTPQALIRQEAELGEDDSVLYRTPTATPESGDIIRHFVKPPKSPGAKLDVFDSKYILIARID